MPRLIEEGLEACLLKTALLAPDDASVRAAEGMLRAAHGKGWARRFGVLAVEGELARPRTPRGPEPVVLSRFAAIMDIRAAENAAELARSFEADAGVKVRAEEGRVLAGVSHAASFAEAGVLEHWVAAEGLRRDQSDPWDVHRARASAAAGVPEGVGRGEPVLEAYFDLNALRRGMPDAFERTRLHRLLREWRLINARSVMVHVHRVKAEQVRTAGEAAPYAGAPLLAIEITWSLRSEPRDSVHAIALARAEWPADAESLGLSPEAADCAIVSRAEWGTWLRVVLGTWRVTGTEFQEMTRTDRIRAWDRKHAAEALGLIQASTGWVLVWASSGDDGSLIALSPLKADHDPQRVRQDLAAMSNSIDPAVKYDRERDWWQAPFSAIGVSARWMYVGSGQERAVLAEITGE